MVVRRPESGLKYICRKFRRPPPRGPQEVVKLLPFLWQMRQARSGVVSVPYGEVGGVQSTLAESFDVESRNEIFLYLYFYRS